MFEINNVQRAANDMEFYSLVVWIEEHRREYLTMMLTGKVVFDEEGD
jgi:hypothetical protein